MDMTLTPAAFATSAGSGFVPGVSVALDGQEILQLRLRFSLGSEDVAMGRARQEVALLEADLPLALRWMLRGQPWGGPLGRSPGGPFAGRWDVAVPNESELTHPI